MSKKLLFKNKMPFTAILRKASEHFMKQLFRKCHINSYNYENIFEYRNWGICWIFSSGQSYKNFTAIAMARQTRVSTAWILPRSVLPYAVA
jgi:hypothetical protein